MNHFLYFAKPHLQTHILINVVSVLRYSRSIDVSFSFPFFLAFVLKWIWPIKYSQWEMAVYDTKRKNKILFLYYSRLHKSLLCISIYFIFILCHFFARSHPFQSLSLNLSLLFPSCEKTNEPLRRHLICGCIYIKVSWATPRLTVSTSITLWHLYIRFYGQHFCLNFTAIII